MLLQIALFATKRRMEHRSVVYRAVLFSSARNVAQKASSTLDVLFVEQISQIRLKLLWNVRTMMKEKGKDVIMMKIRIQSHLNGLVLLLLSIFFKLHHRRLHTVRFLLYMHQSLLDTLLLHLLIVHFRQLISIVHVAIVVLTLRTREKLCKIWNTTCKQLVLRLRLCKISSELLQMHQIQISNASWERSLLFSEILYLHRQH